MSRYEVKVLPWAVTDVHNDYLYLRERSERTAEAFQERVREELLGLRERAEHFQVIKDSIRRCPVKPFRHGILYEIEDERLVVVHTVAHPRREPDFWKNR